MLSQSQVMDYLFHSYVPAGQPKIPKTVVESAHSETITDDKSALIKRGKRALQDAVVDCMPNEPEDMNHILLLSSGWDSRYVLGELLENEHIPNGNIKTITYGVPESWDYQFAADISDYAGVEHYPVNLDRIDWSRSSLEAYVSSCRAPMRFFEGYSAAKSLEQFESRDNVVWSGFFGLAAGPQLSDPIMETWQGAGDWFLDRNRGTELAPESYSPRHILPDEPFLDRAELEYEYQIEMSLRQPCSVGPAVAPPGFNHRFPLLSPEWLEFILNVPTRHRIGAKLYHEIIADTYPELCSLPGDKSHGQPMTAPKWQQTASRLYTAVKWRLEDNIGGPSMHPTNKFRNFQKALRTDTQFKDTVHSLIMDLRERGTVDWVDIPSVWKSHQNGRDRTTELRVLSCIELALRADMDGCRCGLGPKGFTSDCHE